MTMGGELLAYGMANEVEQFDEKFYFELFQPSRPRPASKKKGLFGRISGSNSHSPGQMEVPDEGCEHAYEEKPHEFPGKIANREEAPVLGRRVPVPLLCSASAGNLRVKTSLQFRLAMYGKCRPWTAVDRDIHPQILPKSRFFQGALLAVSAHQDGSRRVG